MPAGIYSKRKRSRQAAKKKVFVLNMCELESYKNQNTAKAFLVATCPNQSLTGKKDFFSNNDAACAPSECKIRHH